MKITTKKYKYLEQLQKTYDNSWEKLKVFLFSNEEKKYDLKVYYHVPNEDWNCKNYIFKKDGTFIEKNFYVYDIIVAKGDDKFCLNCY